MAVTKDSIGFLKNGPNPASSCYFRSFHDARINVTIIDKSVDGVLGTRTRGGRIEGGDKSTELCMTAPLSMGCWLVTRKCNWL